jgi:hypothetical protein
LKNFAAVIFVVIALSSPGCRKKDVVTPVVDARAAAVWGNNEKIFEKALNGHWENDEFDRACVFFEDLTGIEIHVNYSTLGLLPTEETPQDLVRIRDWYKMNKNRLYWDEATGTVKLRPRS